MASRMMVALSPNSPFYALFEPIAGDEFKAVTVRSYEEFKASGANIVLLDRNLLQDASLDDWLSLNVSILLANKLAGMAELRSNVLEMPERVEPHVFKQMIKFASERVLLKHRQDDLDHALRLQGEGAAKLVEVGIALSSESDLERLLEKILAEGRKIAGCDAASLFLVDRSQSDKPKLKFMLTQNQSISNLAFEEQSIPLSRASIVGHSALTGEVLNIDDAYQIGEDKVYQFNQSFDKAMGYRTASLVAIPMRDHHQEIVGVLEFINRKRNPSTVLEDISAVEREVIPFEQAQIDLLRALSSQAAVAIENRKLVDDINRLFDGFVSASVFAIEQRDPCTSGHSFRVASLSEILATQVSETASGALGKVTFSGEQLRELRFAALLHDFGKVGVRDYVLTKGQKLSSERLELMHYRIALAKQQLKNQYLAQLVSLHENNGDVSVERKAQLDSALQADLSLLDDYLNVITQANEPSVMPQSRIERLDAVRRYLFSDHKGNLSSLLSESEYASLSIPRGSLNAEERLEIESHVTHTVNFLKRIPWTSELAGIPGIAGAHHEKLDGSGYPNHLDARDIPVQSRIMTVCDIYDALTAADRPYKPAVPIPKALDILHSEAKAGLLDQNVVDVFTETKVYERVKVLPSDVSVSSAASGYAHHVCDFDLHKGHVH